MADVKSAWNKIASLYRKNYPVSVNTVHYGPLCPGEDRLQLLGNVSGLKVIELGCGAAQNSVYLAKAGAVVTGVDFASAQLKEAASLANKHNVHLELIESDVTAMLALGEATFDLALSACAMAFVPDIDAAFSEVFRVLKPGGRFVLSVMHPTQYIIDGEEDRMYFNSAYPFRPRLLRWSWDFSAGPRRPGKSVRLQHYLRSVAEYHNTLVGAGFVGVRMLEPKPTLKTPHLGISKEIMREYPYIARHLPITLIFVSVRPPVARVR